MGDLSLILFLFIGAVAGWLAGRIMKGKGFGLIVNLIVGVIGSFLGRWLFGLLSVFASEIIGSLLTALAGSIVLLWLISQLKKN